MLENCPAWVTPEQDIGSCKLAQEQQETAKWGLVGATTHVGNVARPVGRRYAVIVPMSGLDERRPVLRFVFDPAPTCCRIAAWRPCSGCSWSGVWVANVTLTAVDPYRLGVHRFRVGLHTINFQCGVHMLKWHCFSEKLACAVALVSNSKRAKHHFASLSTEP
jgi:hypothetical protein